MMQVKQTHLAERPGTYVVSSQGSRSTMRLARTSAVILPYSTTSWPHTRYRHWPRVLIREHATSRRVDPMPHSETQENMTCKNSRIGAPDAAMLGVPLGGQVAD